MTLPNWIPKGFRSMMVTTRRVDPNGDDADLIAFENEPQSEARLQKQMLTDKIRAVKNIAQKIHNKEELIKTARKDLKHILKKQLAELEAEQFELLRDEILNECKDSAGLIDEAKLARVPGSSAFIKKNLKRNKPKN